MPFPDLLQAPEVVVHLLLAAERPTAERDFRDLVTLWHHCCDKLGLSEGVADLPDNPALDAPPVTTGLIAVRQAPGARVRQAMLRREHDIHVLSVVDAPASGELRTWTELESRIGDAIGTSGADARIGSAVILQARLSGAPLLAPQEATMDEEALRADVMAAAGSSSRPGTVVEVAGLGRFAVWEVTDREPAADAWNTRADRRIAVVAPANRDAELSAWTWNRGDAELTPFARYLLHMAKVRYELRLWSTDHDGRRLRRDVDTAIGPLLQLAERVGRTGQEPDAAALLRASAPLATLQADELGLIDRTSRIREIRRTAAIAGRNTARHIAHDQALFADDRRLVEWFDAQLDNDVAYLEAAIDRARSISAFSDQLLQRGQQRRQERFDLALTGVLGAIIMILTAVQALQYKPPLPAPAVPALIAALGALALLMSFIVVRAAVPGRRRWTTVLIGAGAALLGAATGWAIAALVAGDVSPGAGVIWLAAGAGVIVGGGGTLLSIRSSTVSS